MAVTTPDNLRTPNPGDPYNLVADLANLAQDVQDALNTKQSNLLKGTSAQRVSFTSTATNGMLWQDTDGIKMIWRKDGAVWVPAVWRWSGTTAQMNGFTQAPNGFEWFNTSDSSDYVRVGGAWEASGPLVQVGTLTMPAVNAGAVVGPYAVTFPIPFSAAPRVTTESNLVRLVPSRETPTTTGTVVWVVNPTSANQAAGGIIEWVATGRR